MVVDRRSNDAMFAIHRRSLNTTLHPNHPLKICGIWPISVVFKPNTTDFSKSVVFESNTTIFSKTWFELYFIIVFSHLCLHLCFFVCPFCLSPIFCSDCSKLCSVAASVRKIGNYYDDFDSNTSLWPCGIRIWANTRQKYANTQIQKQSPKHFDTVHFSPKTNRRMSWY